MKKVVSWACQLVCLTAGSVGNCGPRPTARPLSGSSLRKFLFRAKSFSQKWHCPQTSTQAPSLWSHFRDHMALAPTCPSMSAHQADWLVKVFRSSCSPSQTSIFPDPALTVKSLILMLNLHSCISYIILAAHSFYSNPRSSFWTQLSCYFSLIFPFSSGATCKTFPLSYT